MRVAFPVPIFVKHCKHHPQVYFKLDYILNEVFGCIGICKYFGTYINDALLDMIQNKYILPY